MNKLPAGWEIKKLKDICTIQDGIHKTPKYTSKGIKFVSVENINDLYNSNKFISEEDYNKMYKIKAKKNDIFMTRIGDIGTPAILNKDEKLAYYVTLCLFTNIDEEVFNKYLYYAIQSNYFKKELYYRTLHVAFPKKINLGDIGDCKFILPPLDEQKRIASALSKIDAYLENTIKLIEEKERFKRGIAKKLLTCKEGENIPEAIFKGFEDEWMEVAISKIGTIITGNTPSTKNESFWNGNNVWITPTDIKQKYISNSERKLTDDGLKKSRKLPANTLLITCIASIGKNAILKCEGACNQQINAIIPNKNYNVDFLYYLFENEKSYLKFKAPQSIIKIMSKSEFSKLVFKFPLLEEQEKIGGYLSLLDKEIDNLKKQKELIKEMKRGAMQKLLSGEVRLSKNAFNENI